MPAFLEFQSSTWQFLFLFFFFFLICHPSDLNSRLTRSFASLFYFHLLSLTARFLLAFARAEPRKKNPKNFYHPQDSYPRPLPALGFEPAPSLLLAVRFRRLAPESLSCRFFARHAFCSLRIMLRAHQFSQHFSDFSHQIASPTHLHLFLAFFICTARSIEFAHRIASHHSLHTGSLQATSSVARCARVALCCITS